jgi:quercetin dioxygenase-like cupin family protein
VGTTEDTPTLVRRADGDTITEREGRQLIVLAERGPITITWSRHAPGEPGPDLHVHRRHTDAFYVLQGELTFPLGPRAERLRLPAGGFVAVPPNVAHAYVNEGDADACWLNLHAPDTGFGDYLRALRDGTSVDFDQFDPPEDGGLPAAQAIVTGPGEGERLGSGTGVVVLKAALTDLRVAECAVDGTLEGAGVGDHDVEIDAYYVLEGQLEVRAEGSAHAAGPGTLVSVPRGARHAFARSARGTARVLSLRA